MDDQHKVPKPNDSKINNSEEDDNNEFSEQDEHEGEIIEEHLEESGSRRKKKRRKIKIRKRVKIKRKASPKKKAKKLIETISWVIILAAFITTLVVLVLHMDLTPKSKKSPKVSELLQQESNNLEIDLKIS